MVVPHILQQFDANTYELFEFTASYYNDYVPQKHNSPFMEEGSVSIKSKVYIRIGE